MASLRKWAPLLIFGLALAARLLAGPRTIDDAFITFRYARNIVAGQGFLYNPGDPVLGTTTPLYTLSLAALAMMTGGQDAPFPSLALVLNAILDGLSALLLIAIGQRLGRQFAGWGAGLAWAIAPFSVTFAIGGLETSLYVFLLLTLAWAYLQEKFVMASLVGGLALLTRPDALILLGPLVADRLYLSWRRSGYRIRPMEVGAFAIPVGAWILFATYYFGSPITHTLTAKSVAYQLPAEAAFVRLLQHYATPFMGHLTFGPAWIGVGLVVYPFLYLIGGRAIVREEPRSWALLAFPWLYFAAFAIANPLIFRWYLTPPLPFYFLIILAGAEKIVVDLSATRLLVGPIRRAPGIVPAAAILMAVVLPAASALKDWQWRPDHGPSRPAPAMAWIELELFYHEAAGILKPLLKPESVLAASDVGVLGYETSARILDTVGLNSPEALAYYPIDPEFYVINLATSPDLIIDRAPDYVVLLEVYGRRGVFTDARFLSTYELLRKLPTDIYSSDGMLIFGKKIP